MGRFPVLGSLPRRVRSYIHDGADLGPCRASRGRRPVVDGRQTGQEEAEKVTTAVLEALSQRIRPGAAADMAAQLPEPLRGPLTGDRQQSNALATS
ncbi:DUF2267 domain-containing protein [Streptomyces sp. NPDC050416]|uniref:DUF2267 domain-containing protein n=1 Tax=Streptomyces sp. NPDC050416 TaxID=3365611 RepID=UPI00379A2F9F